MSLSLDPGVIWRDFTTDGIPASGKWEPRKVDIRQSLSSLRQGVIALLADADPGLSLPNLLIRASDVGAGTPNAIQATTNLPVPDGDATALVALNIFETNTGSPVTVSFNGGTPLTIKTNTGNDAATGGLAEGMIVLGFVSGTTFRILTDQVSEAIVSAAEAALAAAEQARDIAVAAAESISLPPYDIDDAGKALVINETGTALTLGAAGTRRTLDLTYGADPTGTVDCAAAFEAAAAAGGIVYVRPGTYRITTPADISVPLTAIVEAGATFNVEGNITAFNCTSNGVHFVSMFGKPVINGPRTGTDYNGGSRAFAFTGSQATHISRGSVIGFEIKNFREGAIRATFADDLDVEKNYIHDCTYMGAFFLSCVRTKFNYNRVDSIAPGTNGNAPYYNAYGVSWTANVEGVGICSQFQCIGNFISGVTSWTGIDTHGGSNGFIYGNTVTGCYIGIGLTILGTSTAPAYIRCLNNYVQGHANAGVSTAGGTVYPGPGISLAGIQSGVRTQGNVVSNNTLVLCGYNDTGSGNFRTAISLQSTQGTSCHDNMFIACRAMAIGIYYVNLGLDVHSNTIQELDVSNGENPTAIRVFSATNVLSLRGNKLLRGSNTGTAYLYDVAAQNAGWQVAVSRDSFVHNATKWVGSSNTNCIDMGASAI